MGRTEAAIFTTLCIVYDDEQILVQDRRKELSNYKLVDDWKVQLL